MKANLRLAAGTLVAGVGIAVSDGNTRCETPGNTQLMSSLPDVPYPSRYSLPLGGGLILHDGPGHGMR